MFKEYIHPYYYLGGFIGLVVGYLLSKVYQIWAIAFLDKNARLDTQPAFWEQLYQKPALFTFWTVLVFFLICLLLSREFIKLERIRMEYK
jgi:hypothetical protein